MGLSRLLPGVVATKPARSGGTGPGQPTAAPAPELQGLGRRSCVGLDGDGWDEGADPALGGRGDVG